MLTILLAGIVPQQIEWNRFVDAVAYVESGYDHSAVGAKGELGAWQFTRDAWYDACKFDLTYPGLPWEVYATRMPYARNKASAWLRYLHNSLLENLGRPPTAQEVYAAWNCGLAGFRRSKYMPSRVPKTTKAGIYRLEQYLNKKTK